MRHLVFIFLVMFVYSADAAAQQQTPPKGDVERGAFLGPAVKFTRVNDQGGVMLGGRGG